MDVAKNFLENNEILKNQKNYVELRILADPEFAKIQISTPKKTTLNSYVLDYRKLFEIEKEQFYIDGEYAKEYVNPKLTLLEKQEKGTKIIANEDIKKSFYVYQKHY